MTALEISNAINANQDEHVWVPDATEGFVLGVVIRVSFGMDFLLF